MSNQRFQTTTAAMADCQTALETLITAGTGRLSAAELAAAKQLVQQCADITALIAEHAGMGLRDVLEDSTIGDAVLDEYNADAEQEG